MWKELGAAPCRSVNRYGMHQLAGSSFLVFCEEEKATRSEKPLHCSRQAASEVRGDVSCAAQREP